MNMFLLAFLATAQAADPALELLKGIEQGVPGSETRRTVEELALRHLDALNERLPTIAQRSTGTLSRAVEAADLGYRLNFSRNISNLSHTQPSIGADIVQVISGQWAETAMADWTRLPPMARGSHKPATASIGIDPAYGRWFKTVPKASVILRDEGTTGHGNGRIDPGEWIEVEVGVAPAVPDGIFSTSAWVSTASPCVWLPRSQQRERILKEWGFDREPTGVRVQLYVSRDCGVGSSIALQVRVSDSRYGGQEDVLNVRLPVARPIGAEAVVALDTDTPGYSVTTSLPLPFESKFELSAAVKATDAAVASHWHRLPQDPSPFATVDDPGSVEMKRVGFTGFQPADDLDIKLGEDFVVQRWMEKARRPWTQGNEVFVPMGVDVTVGRTMIETPAGEVVDGLGAYTHRFVHFVPIEKASRPRPVAVRTPPPPPPRRPPPPPVEKKKPIRVALGIGGGTDQVMIPASDLEYEAGVPTLKEARGSFRARASVGSRWKLQADVSVNTTYEFDIFSSFVLGPRYNLVMNDVIELGPQLQMGVWGHSNGGEPVNTSVLMVGAGLDVFFVDAFGIWTEVGSLQSSYERVGGLRGAIGAQVRF